MIERRIGSALLLSAMVLGCGEKSGDGGEATGGTVNPPQGGTGATAGAGMGGSLAGTGGSLSGSGGASGGLSGSSGMAGGGAGGDGGGGAGGMAGQSGNAGAGMGGMAGMDNLPPALLSATGLFTARTNGELVLAQGVREFEPAYWLWSDGSDKKRYVYLPPGTQIDTTDADHWVFPVGTKFWKSFIVGTQLVETRLIEVMGAENAVRYATYAWMTPDATDADRMNYRDVWIDAAMTTHDIPNGLMCETCHNPLKEHVLGFSALQLNHDLGGVTLQTLLDESLLTAPIPTTIEMPGDDQATQEVVGYLHANCGNCHNDSPGVSMTAIPAPQMYLRVLLDDETLEDTGLFQTAINQRITGSNELGLEYRIRGGDEMVSAVHVRMNLRLNEDQMPPIGTEVKDTEGLTAIDAWIRSLPPPP
jgi:hypothetical protein